MRRTRRTTRTTRRTRSEDDDIDEEGEEDDASVEGEEEWSCSSPPVDYWHHRLPYQMLLAKLNRLLGVFGHGPIDEEGQTKSMID